MAEEIYPHRVWAEGTGVEPGILRFAHYEIAGVKYVDLLVYSVVDNVSAWRATVRLKGSEIDDLVMALVSDTSAARPDAVTMRGAHAIDEPPRIPRTTEVLSWHGLLTGKGFDPAPFILLSRS